MVFGLLKKPRQWQFLCICAGIGALSFFVIYGVRTLDVGNESWIWAAVPEGDIVQNYAGWMAYRNSPWSFPLAYTDAVCWPDGTLITYMDSNPLLSMVLKLLGPLLPETFVAFGWFTLACYMLQGVAAGLLGQLFVNRPWQAWLVSLLFCFSPILMEKSFRHAQLAAQFLILFALYFYIRMRREGYKKLYWQFILLNVLAVGMFPYFLPMVLAILFAGTVEAAVKTKHFAKLAGFLVLNMAAAVLAGYVIGTIGWENAAYSRGGYGYFSMNLNALFNPTSIGGYRWSWLLGELPQRSGQYDGFNYLGLGVLFFGGVCAVHWLARRADGKRPLARALWQDALDFVRRYPVLVFVCLCLSVFAVSNLVVFSDKTVAELPLPGWLLELCGIFRASGRLFFPVYYLLFLFVLRYFFRHVTPRQAGLLLSLLVAVQLVDLSGVVAQKHSYYANTPAVDAPVTDPVLVEAARRCEYLILLEDSDVNHYYTALAAKYGLKTNSHTVNSGAYPGAVEEGQKALERLLSSQFDPDTIYLAETQEADYFIREALAGQPVDFYEYDGYYFVIPR